MTANREGGHSLYKYGQGCADKRVLIFSLSGKGVCFIVKKSGKEFKFTCLERGSCLSG